MSAVELTDIDSVRQFMQKSVADKLQDEDLEVLISQASEAIARYTNREFGPTTGATRSFEFPYHGSYDVLDLAPYEIRTLTAAVVDPGPNQFTLVEGQFQLRPYPSIDGTFFGIRLSGLRAPTARGAEGSEYPFFTRRVDITGNWGMEEVPREIERLANVLVESWAHSRRDPGYGQGEQFGEATPMRGYDLPPAVFYALKRWQRPEPKI